MELCHIRIVTAIYVNINKAGIHEKSRINAQNHHTFNFGGLMRKGLAGYMENGCIDREAADCTITLKQFERLGGALLPGDRKKAADIILKVAPERIHTIIYGYFIMRYIVRRFGIKKMTVESTG